MERLPTSWKKKTTLGKKCRQNFCHIFNSPWATGVKSIVKNSSCDDHMTVKEALKISQQIRLPTKQGERPPALGSDTLTVGLRFTSKKRGGKPIKNNNKNNKKKSHSQYPESETYKQERKKNAVSKTVRELFSIKSCCVSLLPTAVKANMSSPQPFRCTYITTHNRN